MVIFALCHDAQLWRRAGSRTRAKVNSIHLPRARGRSTSAQASSRGAGGADIVDEQDGLVLHLPPRHPPAAWKAPRTLRRRSPDVEPHLAAGAPAAAPGASGRHGVPEIRAICCASKADWLKRRRHRRQRNSGTGRIRSASASSRRPARAIMRAMRCPASWRVAVLERVDQQPRRCRRRRRPPAPGPRPAGRPAPPRSRAVGPCS